jgi:hypothetical protein
MLALLRLGVLEALEAGLAPRVRVRGSFPALPGVSVLLLRTAKGLSVFGAEFRRGG